MLEGKTRSEWIAMKSDVFIEQYVTPMRAMSTDEFSSLIASTKYDSFECFIQKCWEEQDKMPSQDPDRYNDAYVETLPIMLVLEKALSVRIQTERDMDRKNLLSKQFSMATMILAPYRKTLARAKNK